MIHSYNMMLAYLTPSRAILMKPSQMMPRSMTLKHVIDILTLTCGLLKSSNFRLCVTAKTSMFYKHFLLANLSRRLKGATQCLLSVIRPSVNFSHFWLLLWHCWRDFNKTQCGAVLVLKLLNSSHCFRCLWMCRTMSWCVSLPVWSSTGVKATEF